MLSSLRHWSLRLLARLPEVVPCSCALCGADDGKPLCDGCRSRYLSQGQHRCMQCALPIPKSGGRICGACLSNAPTFDESIAAVDYAAPFDQLVLALKFGSRLEIAPLLAEQLCASWKQAERDAIPDRLTAVPLGPRRLVERGFNQALEIARPLGRAMARPIESGLIFRRHDTHAQAQLPPAARRDNVRRAFDVPARAIPLVRGAHIGVVDDVMTTGETLEEIARTLKRYGATRVTNFVFARTSPQ